jgi:superfamily I DNA and/or RNA helicase
MLIDTAGCKMGENNSEANDFSKSKFNLGEADIVRVILEELLLHGLRKEHIGVITPYNSQVNQIKQLLEDLEVPESVVDPTVIEVSTVDGFQGR